MTAAIAWADVALGAALTLLAVVAVIVAVYVRSHYDDGGRW